ncbi:MAG: uroporphyrinogen decarboxylase family protein [Rhodospirillales bacterium]|jgi:MtaA/CmuA family methyltransferase|nr:uroporphyrinogen decarboxylase family protein [Rhodospirillales bacterium]MDP7425045.1 uroporphyrinogen decarboxylase family protein [Rhodospirillales bacterium]MDP7611568.1 uroporphyrinogen decarboxylase family protein [Nitrospinaceae bacterium]|tara:strand:- start:75 stop:1088 length:1014 start_codon:yes stop_codon:yes gene_type:complete
MDSTERVYAALSGQLVDRPPVFPQIGDHAGIIDGLTYNVMYEDPLRAAEAHLKAQKLYGYDITAIQVEPSWPVAEACGAAVTYPPNKYPWITDYLIKEDADLAKLEVPDFMATQSSRTMIEGTRILAERSSVPVAGFMSGPVTFALQLMPYTTVIKKFIRQPDFVHELIGKSVEVIKAYGRALQDAGATVFVICEHDVQMLSPKHVREFCIDYLPEVCTVYDYNILHMCGKITPHLEASAAFLREVSGLATINVGPHVDIANTQELLQHKIGVAGNIDHIELLPLGIPEDVETAVHAAIKASGGDNRFMVAPGCEITSDTPVENIKAFVRAAKSYSG